MSDTPLNTTPSPDKKKRKAPNPDQPKDENNRFIKTKTAQNSTKERDESIVSVSTNLFRQTVRKTVNIKKIVRALAKQAYEGDKECARLLLEHGFGKPGQVDNDDTDGQISVKIDPIR